jgi:hypothetical protein
VRAWSILRAGVFPFPSPAAVETVKGRNARSVFAWGPPFGSVVLLGGPPLLPSGPFSYLPARSPEMDARILNFALLLEYVEFAISEDAPTRAPLTGDLLDFARKVCRQERAHVRILQDSFGSATRSRPTFQFGEATSDPERFSTTALLLEESALAAYIDRPVLLIDVVDASDTGDRTHKANPTDAFFPIAQIERIEGIDEDGLFVCPLASR